MNDFEDFLNKLKNKLENDPEMKRKVDEHISALEDIFETEVDVSIIYSSNVSEYREIYDGYKESLVEPDEKSTMILDDFIEMLNNEEGHLKLSFDPIYLKEGVNNINNMLITTYEDNIIIIPTIAKKEEE